MFRLIWKKVLTVILLLHEGAASANFIIPASISSIVADETTNNWKMVTLSPLTARWIRFKLTGKNSNPSTTTLNGYLHEQSEVS